jgi:PilZ domain
MRYPIQALVYFWWNDENVVRRGDGAIRDVSEHGAFVIASECPPVGADVELRFFFPQLAEAVAPARMEAEATVLRVEEISAAKGCGFAVLTKSAILLEYDETQDNRTDDGSRGT